MSRLNLVVTGIFLNIDPLWIVWAISVELMLILFLYGHGVLLISLNGRYYGATELKIFDDLTEKIESQ